MNSDFDYGALSSSTPETVVPKELSEGADHETRERSRTITDGIDTRLAILVVVAIILVAIGGGLFARDAWARHIRDVAVRQIEKAKDSADYLAVIKASEDFLSHPPINGSKDDREATVIDRYSEALVHWIAQRPAKLDAPANDRIARYKQLVKSPE
jgi:hypothetical protein